jgi:phosphoribosylformimino-5-aminoimidazole carboxamide ribotide isomerase
MEVIPAIDLKGGRCVRLYQGDFDKVTVFSDDPAEMARRWEGEGAGRIHVVDLDGAKEGHPVNVAAISAILGAVKVPVQAGGGIRTYEDVQRLLGLGVGRAVLGTAAIEDAGLVERLCRDFGREAIVVSVDARDGLVTTHGWQKGTTVEAVALVRQMAALGVERFVYTDVSRDGTLTEPNFGAIGRLVKETGRRIIAAGGVSRVEHIARLAKAGVEGAIVGRALYTGDIDLKAAIRATKTRT